MLSLSPSLSLSLSIYMCNGIPKVLFFTNLNTYTTQPS